MFVKSEVLFWSILLVLLSYLFPQALHSFSVVYSWHPNYSILFLGQVPSLHRQSIYALLHPVIVNLATRFVLCRSLSSLYAGVLQKSIL